MPAIEMEKGKPVKPLVLMTRPDGLPANVPARLVEEMLEKGGTKGYKESKEVTAKRLSNNIDLGAENKRLKDEMEVLKKHINTSKK
jgi:hypothetical protein